MLDAAFFAPDNASKIELFVIKYEKIVESLHFLRDFISFQYIEIFLRPLCIHEFIISYTLRIYNIFFETLSPPRFFHKWTTFCGNRDNSLFCGSTLLFGKKHFLPAPGRYPLIHELPTGISTKKSLLVHIFCAQSCLLFRAFFYIIKAPLTVSGEFVHISTEHINKYNTYK